MTIQAIESMIRITTQRYILITTEKAYRERRASGRVQPRERLDRGHAGVDGGDVAWRLRVASHQAQVADGGGHDRPELAGMLEQEAQHVRLAHDVGHAAAHVEDGDAVARHLLQEE